MRERPLWLRKSARQLVAQWTARKVPSAWCEDYPQWRRLVIHLCLELVLAISQRVPDQKLSEELIALHDRARERGL
jgi:predicted glycosyl hydrolase (DUF1957 family)